MVKHFCDICKKEIKSEYEGSRYKVKKERGGWDYRYWERLYVHKDCWCKMCIYIREQRGAEDVSI